MSHLISTSVIASHWPVHYACKNVCWHLLQQLFQGPDIYQCSWGDGMVQVILISHGHQRAMRNSSKAFWKEHHEDAHKSYQALLATWATIQWEEWYRGVWQEMCMNRVTKIRFQSEILFSALSGIAVLVHISPHTWSILFWTIPIQRSKCQLLWKWLKFWPWDSV